VLRDLALNKQTQTVRTLLLLLLLLLLHQTLVSFFSYFSPVTPSHTWSPKWSAIISAATLIVSTTRQNLYVKNTSEQLPISPLLSLLLLCDGSYMFTELYKKQPILNTKLRSLKIYAHIQN